MTPLHIDPAPSDWKRIDDHVAARVLKGGV